jgi:hypothetical protein
MEPIALLGVCHRVCFVYHVVHVCGFVCHRAIAAGLQCVIQSVQHKHTAQQVNIAREAQQPPTGVFIII